MLTDCNGNPINGLAPSIQVATGDQTDIADNTITTITGSTSTPADTGSVMRQTADGSYIYNLRVSFQNNSLGKYTIVITPNISAYVPGMTLRHTIYVTK